MVIIARSRNDNGCWTIRGRGGPGLSLRGKLFPDSLMAFAELAQGFGFSISTARLQGGFDPVATV